MSWVCRGCGRDAIHIRTIVDDGELYDQCDHPECGNLSMIHSGVPDVYLARSGQRFENLTDDMGRPIEITSKRHKKEVMTRLGVSEAGDKVNGAPWGSKDWITGSRDARRKEFAKQRPVIRETYRRWKETGYAGHK